MKKGFLLLLSLLMLVILSTSVYALEWTLVDDMAGTKLDHWIEVPDGYTIDSGQYYVGTTASKKHGFYSNESTLLGELPDGSLVLKYFGKAGGTNTNRMNFYAVGNGTWTNGSAFAHFDNGITIHRDGGSNVKIYRYNNGTQTEVKSCTDFTPDTSNFHEYKLILNQTNNTVDFLVQNDTKCSAGFTAGWFEPENTKFGIQNSNGGSSSTALHLANFSYSGSLGGAPPAGTQNLSVSVTDEYDGSNVDNVTVIVGGVGRFDTVGFNTSTTLGHNDTSLYNITLQTNVSGGYFNSTFLNYNVSQSTNIETQMYQAELLLTAHEIISNQSISHGSYFTPLQNRAQGVSLKLKAGTYAVTFVNSSYLNHTVFFTVTNLQNLSEAFQGVPNSRYRFTAKNLVTGGSITNFTINISFSNSSTSFQVINSTTNGTVEVKALQGLNYSTFIDAQGFQVQNLTDSLNTTTQNHEFQLYTINSFNFTFRGERNKSILYGAQDIVVEFISNLQSYNFTANGTLYVDLITPGDYVLRYSKPGFGRIREFYYRLTNATHQELDLYLLDNAVSSDLTVTVYDTNTLQRVEDAVLYVQRYRVDTNAYETVAMYGTDVAGNAFFDVEQKNELYQFLVDSPWLTRRLTTSPAYIESSSINLYINTFGATGAEFFEEEGISARISFLDASQQFELTWTDSEATATQHCLDLKVYEQYSKDTLNTSCSTSNSGTILLGGITTNRTYYAVYRANIDGSDQVIKTAWQSIGDPSLASGSFGYMLAALIFMSVALLSTITSLAALLGPISIIFSKLFGLISFDWPFVIMMVIASVILTIIINLRSR